MGEPVPPLSYLGEYMQEEWIKHIEGGPSLSAIFTVQHDNTVTIHVSVLREMLVGLGFEPVDNTDQT